MICRNCKRELPKGSRRCKYCGKTVGGVQYFFSRCFDTLRIPIALVLLLALILGIFLGIRALTGAKDAPAEYDRAMGTYTPEEANIVYEDENESIGYVNNMILIFFSSDTDDARISEIIKRIDGEVVGIMPGVDQFQVQVEARTKEELEKLRERLLQYDEVKNVMIDYVVATGTEYDAIPGDPWADPNGYSSTSWDEENPGDSNWWVEAAHILSAWEYQEEFNSISVGVVDGGFDTAHEDLNILVLNDGENDPDDHGTAVAGIIGATANNGVGITGILQDVNLYGVDFYATAEQEAQNIAISTMFDGLNACVMSGCRVVNLSSGLYYENVLKAPAVAEYTGLMAIEYLVIMMDAYDHDFIIVQSSGNGDGWGNGVDAFQYNGYFCSVDLDLAQAYLDEAAAEGIKIEKDITAEDIVNSIMVVASVDCEFIDGSYQLAVSSNFGPAVTIAAPGVQVLTTTPGNSYRYANGTSFSAPVTSGITGMVWSVDPGMSAAEVKNIVVSTATVPVLPRTYGDTGSYYMIDAKAAVEKAIELRDSRGQIEEPVEIPVHTSDYGVYPDQVRFIAGSDPNSGLYKFVEGVTINFHITGSDSPATIVGDNPCSRSEYQFDRSLEGDIEAYLELLAQEPFNLDLIHQEQSGNSTYYFYRYNGAQNVYSLEQPEFITTELGEYHLRIEINNFNESYISFKMLVGFGLESINAEEYKTILSGGSYERDPEPIIDIQ